MRADIAFGACRDPQRKEVREVVSAEGIEMVAGNQELSHLARKGRGAGKHGTPMNQGSRDRSRPRSQPTESIPIRRANSDMWAKSVSKGSDDDSTALVEPLLVPEAVAAEMLGVSERTVWQLGHQGDLRVKRIGRRKLYLVESLKTFAEGGKEVE
jgi:hypothetical protein